MVPRVIVTPGFRVAYRAGLHRAVVEHQVIGTSVAAAEHGVAGFSVQVGVVADYRRRAGPLLGTPGPGVAAGQPRGDLSQCGECSRHHRCG